MSRFTNTDRTKYPHYRCAGMDSFRFAGQKISRHRQIRLDRLDAAVWTDVCGVLQNQQALRQEFEQRLSHEGEPGIDVDRRVRRRSCG
jgi:hypothetical protein